MRAVEAALEGTPLRPTEARLVEHLVDAGALHPIPDASVGSLAFGPGDVTVVVPALDTDVQPVLEALGPVAAVVVVDDASAEPVNVPPGRTSLRHGVNRGPGAARNTGLAAVTTPLVAFVDADCRPQPGWLTPLLAHFADERLALVAPRVASAPGPGLLARYEQTRSPLDLGAAPARVRAGTRVSYVPGAALLVRADAVRAIGGFDERHRVGEDVDLVWRLDEAGWRCRYEPRAVVWHLPRSSVAGMARQRFEYGRSAGPLAARHPNALAPVAVSGWSAVVWAAVAAGAPLVGGAVAAGTVLVLARRLKQVPQPLRMASRLAGMGHVHAGRLLAAAITRAWWPVLAVAALVSRRARRVLLLAFTMPALISWLHDHPALGPGRYVVLRALDDGSYAAGVWAGSWRARTTAPLRPDFTTWPRRTRVERRAAPASLRST